MTHKDQGKLIEYGLLTCLLAAMLIVTVNTAMQRVACGYAHMLWL